MSYTKTYDNNLKVYFDTDGSVSSDDFDGFALSWRCDPDDADPPAGSEQFELTWKLDGGQQLHKTHIAFWNGDDFLKHQFLEQPWNSDIINLGFLSDFDLIQLKPETDSAKTFSVFTISSETRSIDLVAQNGGPVQC